MNNLKILVADIGGTNSRFAIFNENCGGGLLLEKQVWVRTAAFESFVQLLDAVKKEYSLEHSDIAVFGVPGPVIDHKKVSLVNAPWDIDISELQDNNRIFLINDFESQAYGCLVENFENFGFLNNPDKTIKNGFVVVGAGTGLGHCAVKKQQDIDIIIPSEAGQIIFPFIDEELKFLDFVKERINGECPTGDIIVSGQGLSLVHEYHTGKYVSPEKVVKEIDGNSETTKWFARFFGRVCKNYVLTVLPFCDVLFLSGGVIIKNSFLVNNKYFIEEFLRCETKKNELKNIGIKIIINESIGLLGSARFAQLITNFVKLGEEDELER